MLNYDQVMNLFGGVRTALQQDRKPSNEETLAALNDLHHLLASVVSSLTTIARAQSEKGIL